MQGSLFHYLCFPQEEKCGEIRVVYLRKDAQNLTTSIMQKSYVKMFYIISSSFASSHHCVSFCTINYGD